MIELLTGDILKANAEALVNTVNCVGFMGRGIAAQFKRTFPENFKEYASVCKRGGLKPGVMLVHRTGQLTNPRYIVNFPTKRHWRGASRLEDIDAGLEALVREIQARQIASIAVPPLGCGLGGLPWGDVKPRIERAFAALPSVRVLVFEPTAAPEPSQMSKSTAVPKMTPGRAVLVGLVDHYLAGLMEPFVTLLEVQKLLYFVQEAGEPLRLKYVKALYGPYAENLRHVLAAVEGHLVVGYADGGDAPDKQLELVPGAVEDASAYLAEHPHSLVRFARVTKLVEGFETPFGMELLASVHWVATREHAERDSVVSAVHAWNARKRQFSERQLLLAFDVLSEKGWLLGAGVAGTAADTLVEA
jgi:O-acetyl-ADP-ribose deacetylase (regulator of RNase III)